MNVQDLFHSYEILLASRSPRRSLLLKELGIPFRVVETDQPDEQYPDHLKGGEIAGYLARHKSDCFTGSLEMRQILLTADTIVWQEESELGKPGGREEAVQMILRLSGKTHQVFTGVCLRSARSVRTFVARTDVTFSSLREEEVEYYVDRFRPFDKAGAYGIQEWIGFVAVEKIVGSYFNVMGLPVHELYDELKSFTADG